LSGLDLSFRLPSALLSDAKISTAAAGMATSNEVSEVDAEGLPIPSYQLPSLGHKEGLDSTQVTPQSALELTEMPASAAGVSLAGSSSSSSGSGSSDVEVVAALGGEDGLKPSDLSVQIQGKQH
jgi:hypothetical protein